MKRKNNSSSDEKKPLSSEGEDPRKAYNYGFYELLENCTVVDIDLDGADDLCALTQADCMNISSVIKLVCERVAADGRECLISVNSNKQTRNGHILAEYIILLQFPHDTPICYAHFDGLIPLSGYRIQSSKIISVYDKQFEKQCVHITLGSTLNPVLTFDTMSIHQTVQMTIVASHDDDGTHGLGKSSESSFNRKRVRKGDLSYEKHSERS